MTMNAADLLAMQQAQNDSILARQKKLINDTANHTVAERTRTGERNQVDNAVGWQNDLRNFNQQQSAKGLSGGASESAALSLTNTYRNNRMNTDSETNSDNAATRLQQQSDLATAQNDWATRNTDYLSQYYSNQAAEDAAAAAAAAAAASGSGSGGGSGSGSGTNPGIKIPEANSELDNIPDWGKYKAAKTLGEKLKKTQIGSNSSYVQSEEYIYDQMSNAGYSNQLIAYVINQLF